MQKELKDKEEIIEESLEENQDEEVEEVNEAALYKQQFEEIEDRYKRICAEFDNYKKRTEKENTKTYDYAKISIITGLLPILDSFEKSMESDSKDKSYKEGIELIYKQFQDYLKSQGVEAIETEGQKFDPELHEAVNLVEDSGLESGMIVQSFRTGYKMRQDVIRHSMVVVQK